MHVELHSPGVKLHRAHTHMLLACARQTFSQAAGQIARVVLRITTGEVSRTPSRQCEVEVHLRDGRITRIQEQHRRIGALVRRAVQRAWRKASPSFSPAPARLPLPAGSKPTR